MVRLCSHCNKDRAVLRRPKTLEQICKGCFYQVFEDEVHQTITSHGLFKRGERVAIAASGGKDSTVLAHLMTLLNQRHDYGLDLFLLSIDEGISGYRDDSLETVQRNRETYGIPLEVVSYQQLYGWTMDDIVAQIGTRNNCTFCGVFRRQALDRGAALMGAQKIATGHNADDVAETVLLNILRGDVPRLSRCANIITGEGSALPRVKPFKYTYEKEIVMYAYFKRLDYFSTECVYAPFAARGFAREFIKDLEALRPSGILDIIRSAEQFQVAGGGAAPGEGRLPQPRQCERCGYISSQPVCKACVLLEGLNRGLPRLGVSRTRGTKTRRAGLHQEVGRDSTAADATAATADTAAGDGGDQQQQGNARVGGPAEVASSHGAGAGSSCGGPCQSSGAVAGCSSRGRTEEGRPATAAQGVGGQYHGQGKQGSATALEGGPSCSRLPDGEETSCSNSAAGNSSGGGQATCCSARRQQQQVGAAESADAGSVSDKEEALRIALGTLLLVPNKAVGASSVSVVPDGQA